MSTEKEEAEEKLSEVLSVSPLNANWLEICNIKRLVKTFIRKYV